MEGSTTRTVLFGNPRPLSEDELKSLDEQALKDKKHAAVLVIHHARKFKRDDSGKRIKLSDASGAGMLGRLSSHVLAMETRKDQNSKIFTIHTVKCWWEYPEEFSLEVNGGTWEDDGFPKLEMHLVDSETKKPSKGIIVRNTVFRDFGNVDFTRSELEEAIKGTVSERTIRGALAEMADKGEIIVINSGRSTKYRIPQVGEIFAGEEAIA